MKRTIKKQSAKAIRPSREKLAKALAIATKTLNDHAAWSDGCAGDVGVTSSFDCPGHATSAREALAAIRKALAS